MQRMWVVAVLVGCGSSGGGGGGGGVDAPAGDGAVVGTQLATGLDLQLILPIGLAQDASSIYVITRKQLLALPRGGGSAQPLAAAPMGETLQGGLALDATTAYVTVSDGSILAAPLAGGGSASVLLAAAIGERAPIAVALHGSDLVWTDAANGGLFSVPITGGSASVIAPGSAGNQGLASGLAADATDAFWTTYANGSGGGDGLYTCALAACTPANPVTDPAVNVVIDANRAYVATEAAVVSVPRAGGGSATTLATVEDTGGLATDGTTLYFASNLDGRIEQVPCDGSAPATVFASVGAHPDALAIDATTLYVTTVPDGSVYAFPR